MSQEDPLSRRRECRMCGSREYSLYLRKDDFRIERCLSCDLIQVSDPIELTAPAIEKIYDKEFFDSTYGDLIEPSAVDKTRDKNDHRLGKIERLKPERGHLLDVGCSFGHFLARARDRGWEVSGVEVGPYAVKYATNELGLEVHSGSLIDAGLPDEHLDVVTMWDVIEHLDDPVQELREVHRILRPSGLLVVNTPDVSAYMRKLQGRRWRCFIPPIHLIYFEPPTLQAMLERTGYRVLESTVSLPMVGLLQRLRLLALLERLKVSDKVWMFAQKEG